MVDSRQTVHGHNVLANEEVIMITKIFNDELLHPEYNYELCVEGYVAWDRSRLIY